MLDGPSFQFAFESEINPFHPERVEEQALGCRRRASTSSARTDDFSSLKANRNQDRLVDRRAPRTVAGTGSARAGSFSAERKLLGSGGWTPPRRLFPVTRPRVRGCALKSRGPA
jgi:hypothetical protein